MVCIKGIDALRFALLRVRYQFARVHDLCNLSCSLYHSGVYVGWRHSQKWPFHTDRSIQALSGHN